MIIKSLQNPTVKAVVKLRESRERRKLGQFLIDGNAEIERAIANGIDVLKVFVEADATHSVEFQSISDRLQLVSPDVLDRLSYGGKGAEPVAIARTPNLSLAEIELGPHSLVLVLDRIEKPGNLGACLRTSVACGADAVILTNPVCEVYNPNTIRSSRGAVFTIPIAVSTTQQLIDEARQIGLGVWGARVDGDKELWSCDFRQGSAIVFGNEALGLGDDWRHAEVKSFQIPMSARMDSLNVSISTAVTLYEAVRQRRD